MIADKAYSSAAIRRTLRERGIAATIPERVDQNAGRARHVSRGGRPMDEFDARTDEDTEQLAAELYRRVRDLNNSAHGRRGLERPETAYTVLGNLTRVSFGLAQTAGQPDAFLDRELWAGRLGHERGSG
ncbi:hypothetical protein H4W34_006852 [Actinomadura algeriensis]|uniref:DDE family transposase n=1 Tax=Actinomadura algeriensis TaxID=1679523 RepID=A0ABR9K2E2_9ACTN|nr:hypothetical protein [Actinomadura algeriensis]